MTSSRFIIRVLYYFIEALRTGVVILLPLVKYMENILKRIKSSQKIFTYFQLLAHFSSWDYTLYCTFSNVLSGKVLPLRVFSILLSSVLMWLKSCFWSVWKMEAISSHSVNAVHFWGRQRISQGCLFHGHAGWYEHTSLLAGNEYVCVCAHALSKIHLLKQHYKLTLFCFIVIGKFHWAQCHKTIWHLPSFAIHHFSV